MKNDTSQRSALPTISSEPKNASTPTVKELNKEAEKKEAAAEAMRTRCKTCFKETSPNRLCGGHGGGSGGGSSGGGSDGASEDNASPGDSKLLAGKSEPLGEDRDELASESSLLELDGELDTQSQTDEASFNPEVIAELIANGLLQISNDRESKTLSIILQCEPNSLSKEQQLELNKFIKAIQKELDEFKKENHISEDCINIIHDKKGNIISLHIELQTLAQYNAFIQRLANNLLPSTNLELQNQKTERATPTPFAMEPKPSRFAEDKPEQKEELASEETKDEEEEPFNPSPFSTTMKPW